MNKDTGLHVCPICYKYFKQEEIQCHVDKCMFLNSQSESKSSVKRHSIENSVTQNDNLKRLKPSQTATGFTTVNELNHNNGLGNQSTFSVGLESSVPLAEQMRPVSLLELVGQEHVLGENKVLRSLLEKQEIPSMILWGPPGCGKTSLANVINKQIKERNDMRFVKLSATMSGVSDVKELVKQAKNELISFKRRTVLFMDEIHRFNKLQQDIFLPHVESGVLILVGATTENPSFSLNSALLSRCRVIVLEKLTTVSLLSILYRAVIRLGAAITPIAGGKPEEEQVPSGARYSIDQSSLQWLAEMCDGDARIALNSLQIALQFKSSEDKPVCITLEDIKDGIKRSHLLYDRKGEEHYNIISALHKSIRASDDSASLYWVTRMLEGGEDPLYIARRLVRVASEDIGLADPMALTMAVSAMQACQQVGMPECDVFLAQTAVYLARADKSQEVYHALGRAKQCIAEHRGCLPSVPLHLRNAPTKLMHTLGYGKDYNTKHKDHSNLTYMPDGMENVTFFNEST